MQRKSLLVKLILVLLATTMLVVSCFSSRKERTNGGRHRQKLSINVPATQQYVQLMSVNTIYKS